MDKYEFELKKSLGFKPTIGVIDPECVTFLQRAGEQGLRSEWLSRAAQMLYDYEHYKKGFLIRIIESNFELCKSILRKVGRARKKNELRKLY